MTTVKKEQQCPHDKTLSCANCRLGSICLPLALTNDDVGKLDDIVSRGRPLQKGHILYEQDSDFDAIYAVRSGAIKTRRISQNGVEQVMGFYLPGEIFGVDGLSHHKYSTSAIALDTTAVCKIPFSQLETLSLQLPSLQRHFFQIMSREITADQKMLTLVSKNTADERVAALLLSFSSRNARRQLSGERFMLPMSRQDLGNFLGLTIETVSRVLRRMKDNNVVGIDGREVHIQDMCALRQLADV